MEDLEKLAKEKLVLVDNTLHNSGSDFKANIWKLYIYQFLMNFHMISGVLIPFFLLWGKITFVELMFLEAYFTIAVFAFEVPCGAISDYLSRKFSLTLAGLTGAIAVIVYSSYPNILVFALGETIFAFAAALISGTDQAIIYDTLKRIDKSEEISKVMGRMNISTLLSILISAPLGSVIAFYTTLNLPMLLMTIPFSAALFVSATLKDPNHNSERQETKYTTVIKSGFKELKKNKALRILAVDSISIEILAFFMIWTYQLYLQALLVPIVLFGFVAASLTLVQVLLTNLIPKFEKKTWKKNNLLFAFSIIPGIAYISMVFIHFLPLSLLLILLVVGFGLSRRLLFVKAINEQIQSENRATVLSTINMIGSLIRASLYPIVGILVMVNLYLAFLVLGCAIIIITVISRIKNDYN